MLNHAHSYRVVLDHADPAADAGGARRRAIAILGKGVCVRCLHQRRSKAVGLQPKRGARVGDASAASSMLHIGSLLHSEAASMYVRCCFDGELARYSLKGIHVVSVNALRFGATMIAEATDGGSTNSGMFGRGAFRSINRITSRAARAARAASAVPSYTEHTRIRAS